MKRLRIERTGDQLAGRHAGGPILLRSARRVSFFVLTVLFLGCLLLALAPSDNLNAAFLSTSLNRAKRLLPQDTLVLVRISGVVGCLVSLGLIAFLFVLRGYTDKLLSYIAIDASHFAVQLGDSLREWKRMPTFGFQLLGLAVLVVIAGLVRAAQMSDGIAYDEAVTYVSFVSRTWVDVISDYSVPNNHVFHSILAYLSAAAFGPTVVALRLPAFVAGLMTVPVSFWWAWRIFGDERTALLTAGLVTASPPLVAYSAQARGYTIVTLLFLVLLIVAGYLREKVTLTASAVFVILGAIGLYTVPVMLYPLALVLTWAAITAGKGYRKKVLVHSAALCAGIGAVTFVLYLPVIARTGLLRLIDNPYVVPLPLRLLLSETVKMWGKFAGCCVGGYSTPMRWLLAGGGVMSFIAVLRGDPRLIGLVFSVLLSYLALVSLHPVAPPMRALLFLYPLVYGVISYGLVTTVRAVVGFESRLSWRSYASPILTVAIAVFWIGSELMGASAAVRAGKSHHIEGPGSIRLCAPSYFGEAELIVTEIAPILGKRDVISSSVYEAVVKPVQFYLLTSGYRLGYALSYEPQFGLDQLRPFDKIYFVSTERGGHMPLANLLMKLECTQEEFDATFSRATLVREYTYPGSSISIYIHCLEIDAEGDRGHVDMRGARKVWYSW